MEMSRKFHQLTSGVVRSNMMIMSLFQLVNAFSDGVDASRLSHQQRREVGMTSGSVPVSGDRLRVQRGHDAEILANAMKDESGHPQMIAAFDAFAGTNLILPLRRHHFRVGAADLNSSVQTRLGIRAG